MSFTIHIYGVVQRAAGYQNTLAQQFDHELQYLKLVLNYKHC